MVALKNRIPESDLFNSRTGLEKEDSFESAVWPCSHVEIRI